MLAGARNKYTDRLLSCARQVVRIVPAAAAGNASPSAGGAGSAGGRRGRADSATAESTLRDAHSGRLTSLGKQLILEGRSRCKVGDVLEPRALTRDPLDCPLCSYEIGPLARLLVHASKQLNEHFHLPADNQQIMCSWETIIKRARAVSQPGDYFHPLRVAQSSFRFNLRFLASCRVFSSLAIAVLIVLAKHSLISPLLFLILVAAFGALSYKNSLPI